MIKCYAEWQLIGTRWITDASRNCTMGERDWRYTVIGLVTLSDATSSETTTKLHSTATRIMHSTTAERGVVLVEFQSYFSLLVFTYAHVWEGVVVASWRCRSVECRTYDQEVMGSTLCRARDAKNSGQVSHTYVPLFTKQYKLVPAKGRWCLAAGE